MRCLFGLMLNGALILACAASMIFPPGPNESLGDSTPASQYTYGMHSKRSREGAISMKRELGNIKPILGGRFRTALPDLDDPRRAASPSEVFESLRTDPEYSEFDDLTLASFAGDSDRVNELLSRGVDLDGNFAKVDSTPLIAALSTDHPEIAKSLLSKGANPHPSTSKGWTALHLAASNGWLEITSKILLQRKVDVNSKTDLGWTPLILAVLRKRADIVGLLLDYGADTEGRDSAGATAVLYATLGGEAESGGDFACLRTLINRGGEVNTQDNRGWTPLMGAAFYGDSESVHLLLSSGAQINLKNTGGETALVLAERGQHTNIVRILSEAGGIR
jgi:ankyrin repeat protein